MKKIRIGTRGSDLALKQTQLVINAIRDAYAEYDCETVIFRTEGDRILEKPLAEFGGKGVFVTELEEALQDGRIDLAVHSAKDMPMEMAAGLTICGVLPREDVRDVLVTRKEHPLQLARRTQPDESDGARRMQKAEENAEQRIQPYRIGTSSLRRQCQLEHLYSNVQCASIRGNVPTRMAKLRCGEYDGVILAAAGLRRLELEQENDLDYHYFSTEEMLPAGGQGIIAIEGRKNDTIAEVVRTRSDQDAWLQLQTEQQVLRLLNAGCHEAVGTTTNLTADRIELSIMKEKDGILYYVKDEALQTEHEQMARKQVEILLRKLQS